MYDDDDAHPLPDMRYGEEQWADDVDDVADTSRKAVERGKEALGQAKDKAKERWDVTKDKVDQAWNDGKKDLEDRARD